MCGLIRVVNSATFMIITIFLNVIVLYTNLYTNLCFIYELILDLI